MKKLVIVEKSSVACDIASALGKIKKQGDWYENDQYVITSSIGHLVELYMPEDIDKSYSYWRMEALPIIPETFALKPIKQTEAQFQQLKKLLRRKDIETVINACDAGREGELIFAYIYELAAAKKPILRLWMQSMTPKAIRAAFAQLREDKEMQPLQAAARCRSEADWLVGINGTRAITKRLYGGRVGNVASVGRVQTPTLTLVHEREQRIRNFVPRDYWRVRGQFTIHQGSYEGLYQRPDFKKSKDEHDRADRLWDKVTAERILAEVRQQPQALVSEEKKRSRQSPPRLYDLTTLQREANGRYGLPAGKTLRLAQALYERHKMLTYPRTDSRALPEDYMPTCKTVLAALPGDLGKHGQTVLESDWVRPNKRLFNNTQVSDHFAIIPTGENKKLNDDEAKIFDMVARRFVAAFFPAAEYNVTIRLSQAGEHTFKTDGKVLTKPGWLVVYGKTVKTVGEGELPALSPEDGQSPQATIASTQLEEEQTKPPPRYTEASLLTAMETAGRLVDDEALADAMKEKGLGTPATRAQIIDHLINQYYLERQSRELIPTTKAEQLVEFLKHARVETLSSPALTGDWEYKLRQIETQQLSREVFMGGIVDMTTQVVERAKAFEDKDEDAEETDILSPTDGKAILKTFRSYKSQDGKLLISQALSNRRLSLDELRTLIQERKIGPLDGFRSKAGKPFSAILELDADNKIKFLFGGQTADSEANSDLGLKELAVIGDCPKCRSSVYEAPNSYACEHMLDGSQNCTFRISRMMLGKTLPGQEIKSLLQNKKTGLIEGFRSNRTKRLFNAFLILKDGGGIGFEFPPRASKKVTKKKTAAKK